MIRSHRDARGCVVVVAGPDGAGKTTLSNALEQKLAANRPVLHFHHRFRMLPVVAGGVLVTDPHRDPPYPTPLSWMKSAYLFADYLLGWVVRVRPHVKRGGWVVIERGWWDLIVDPRRYRLRNSGALLGALGRLLPRPDLVLVLEGPASLLIARKPELPPAEVERQLRMWREVVPRRVHRVLVDVGNPVEDVALAACLDVRRQRDSRVVATSAPR